MSNSSLLPLNECGWPMAIFPNTSTERHNIRYLDLYSYPPLLAIATLGNLVNIIVLKREKPCTPKNVYLIAIALTDLIFMWSAIISYISNYDGEVHGRPTPAIRKAIDRIRGIGPFCQEWAVMSSSWIIIAFTTERFVAIKYPLQHKIKDNLRHCRVNVYGTFLVALLLASHRLVDYYWFHINSDGMGRRPPRPYHLYRWNMAHEWAIVVLQLLTLAVMIILNAMLLREIIRTRQFHRPELAHARASYCVSDGSEISAQLSSASSTTPPKYTVRPERNALILLGGVVLLFLCTQVPAVYFVVLNLLEKSCIREMPVYIKAVAVPLRNFFMNVNFSGNFLVYCSVDRRFRSSVYHVCHAPPERTAAVRRENFRMNDVHKLSEKSTAPLVATLSQE
ncbi:sex peptide receptor-like [Paramacrobiotus metropolitanus]|uniref:sex peptide receptor-like n=1 Tax=Paramacrobiotus metropolitanus TaxID=2943436 RepID=UPI002445615B|nr:sex peptide receptor-like [Paramacrobiotus metropolitanus]XP_055342304.1 sex peptide receptor-like [Paramacrobiotus metropolitanus]XP_055342305.1 sex peptide receptor-like [Paramacrobiotus metropolitanus]